MMSEVIGIKHIKSIIGESRHSYANWTRSRLDASSVRPDVNLYYHILNELLFLTTPINTSH